MWSVSTILTGLLSFMVESQHTTGGQGGRGRGSGEPEVRVRGEPATVKQAQPAGCIARPVLVGESKACTWQGPLHVLRRAHCRPAAAEPASVLAPVLCPPAGAISSSSEEKKRLARDSLGYNVRNPTFR